MHCTHTVRRRVVNGDEVDAHSWFGRTYLACFDRAGVRAKTKRRTRRRERREAGADLAAQLADLHLRH